MQNIPVLSSGAQLNTIQTTLNAVRRNQQTDQITLRNMQTTLNTIQRNRQADQALLRNIQTIYVECEPLLTQCPITLRHCVSFLIFN